MQAASQICSAGDSTGIAGALIDSMRLELPSALLSRAWAVLRSLEIAPGVQEGAVEPPVRVWKDREGWLVEGGDRRDCALTAEEALIRLQEALIDLAICREDRLWLRGSVVSRGSQSLL